MTFGVSAGVVTAKFSVAAAESLFKTEFRQVTHSITQQRVLRAGDYSLPDNVAAATTAIFGMHGLPLARDTSDAARKLGQPGGTPPPVRPDVINKKYIDPALLPLHTIPPAFSNGLARTLDGLPQDGRAPPSIHTHSLSKSHTFSFFFPLSQKKTSTHQAVAFPIIYPFFLK